VREKELRLALVCFGGVSLAVYMHGISKEILKLVRASRALHGIANPAVRARTPCEEVLPLGDPEYDTEAVYFDLLTHIGRRVELRVIVDVVAGSSAGGINGVMLARALAHDLPVGHLRDMWLESGDIGALLANDARAGRWSKFFVAPLVWAAGRSGLARIVRHPEVRRKLSLFVRSRWFKPPFDGPRMSELMYDALEAMGEPVDPAASLVPAGHQLEMFVTLTDFYGYQQHIQIHDPPLIRERDHRHVLRFAYRRYPNGDVESDFERGDTPALAFAARATAAYPGAFPPAQLREIDRLLSSRKRSWNGREKFMRDNFGRYRRAGLDPMGTAFIDGSVLNNKPFTEALAAIRGRPAYRQVDRRLVYIDPDPVADTPGLQGRIPGFLGTLKGALSDIPRNEPISDELESVNEFNEYTRRLRAIIESARPRISRLVTELSHEPLDGALSFEQIRAWREAVSTRAARDAGYAYEGYVRLKLDAVKGYAARLLCGICHAPPKSVEAQAIRAVVDAWSRLADIEYDALSPDMPTTDARPARPPWLGFLLAFDVDFRKRRLAFLIQGRNRQYGLLGAGRDDARRIAEIDALKRGLYQCLDELRRYDKPAFFSQALRDEIGRVFADCLEKLRGGSAGFRPEDYAAHHREALAGVVAGLAAEIDLDAATDDVDRLLARLDPARWEPCARRDVLVDYIGFPFWDVLTFPVTSWSDYGEFDEIRIDRISPEDAKTFHIPGARPVLKGIEFMHFGAFFSRAFRENDYLWGRLHAVDRLIDIVCDSAGSDAISPGEIVDYKRRAFATVLDAEQPHLRHCPELMTALRADLGLSDPGPVPPPKADERPTDLLRAV
jgi:patatin-related protein